jgi:O-methyltransferase
MTNKYDSEFVQELVTLYKKQLTSIREMKLSKNDKFISHQHILSYSTYSPWYDDRDFLEAYDIIRPNSLVDIYRCYELWNFIKKNSHLKGDILEVGVWRGGTGCLMGQAARLYSDCTVYLADTFAGVVKASEEDTLYEGGEHSDTTIETVKELAAKLKLSNIKIMKGIFPEEVNFASQAAIPDIKLCHIDVDTYSSAKDVFEYIWPYMVKGGAVVFDDYGFWGCEGVTKLCNEISLKDACFIHNVNGHALFIKL